MNFERETEAAREAAIHAGKIIAEFSKGDRKHWDKAEDNPVTQADLAANDAIQTLLHRAFPDDTILSEEIKDSKERLRAERVWIIDPLDGTKEFIEGVPEFAVSIALTIRGEPVVGCVHQPLTGESFWGAKGSGAFVDDRRISVTPTAALDESVVLSSRTEMKRGQMGPYENVFKEIKPVGSVALKLALVAAGRADFWISAAPKSEWDVCGGDLLVREAGGTFITLDRGVRVYNQEDILLQPLMAAGSVALVEAFRDLEGKN